MTRLVQVNSSGVAVRDDDALVEAFPWGVGKWSLEIRDTRLSPAHIAPVPFVPHATVTPISGPRAVLRIVSFEQKDRDQDRELMGLRVGIPSDNVLLTDSTLPGAVTLHFGALHIHTAPLLDDMASRMITEAFQRGFEVRQWVTTDGGGYAVVSEITTRLAADTPEVVSKL